MSRPRTTPTNKKAAITTSYLPPPAPPPATTGAAAPATVFTPLKRPDPPQQESVRYGHQQACNDRNRLHPPLQRANRPAEPAQPPANPDRAQSQGPERVR